MGHVATKHDRDPPCPAELNDIMEGVSCLWRALRRRCIRWQRWAATFGGGQEGTRRTRPKGSDTLRVSHACSSEASGDSEGIPNAARKSAFSHQIARQDTLHADG